MITSVLYDVSWSDFCIDRHRYVVKFAGNRFRAGAFFRIFNFRFSIVEDRTSFRAGERVDFDFHIKLKE